MEQRLDVTENIVCSSLIKKNEVPKLFFYSHYYTTVTNLLFIGLTKINNLPPFFVTIKQLPFLPNPVHLVATILSIAEINFGLFVIYIVKPELALTAVSHLFFISCTSINYKTLVGSNNYCEFLSANFLGGFGNVIKSKFRRGKINRNII